MLQEKEEEIKIPVIDMEDFPGEAGKLREASEEWGCFRIVNHNIPLTLMSEMKSIARSLLDLPVTIKSRNVHVKPFTGYMGSEYGPLNEGLGLYDMASSEAVDTFCTQLDASPHHRETIKMYNEALHELALDLAQKLAESMGLVGDLFKGWPCQFRITKYNFNPETVGSTCLPTHTDSGFLTILQDDENISGFEGMDKSGALFPVDPLPGSFLVNIGDTARAWSNGRLNNVKHRVQCKEASIRVSILTFMLGQREGNVEAPPEFVDSEHPRLYVPFAYEDYRNLMLSSGTYAGEALELLRTDS